MYFTFIFSEHITTTSSEEALKVRALEFWYFKSLCNRDAVSNITYQNFLTKSGSDQEVNAQIDT